MTKSELIKTLAMQKSLSLNDAEVVVNAVFETIGAALERGDRVEIRGFGSFGIKHRQSRSGRNPRTGESVSVDAKKVMFFKAGKELKERVDV
ncbi:MAG: ihfB [Magnetococcales bacterium]|nr:ihfB [Magnetococcales bacterium]HIJ84470.1 integration host factor subunit beta [Magnetococcales bacterium]